MRLAFLGLVALVSAAAPAAFAQGEPGTLPSDRMPPPLPRPPVKFDAATDPALQDPALIPAAKLAADFGLVGQLATDCSIPAGKPGRVEFTDQGDGTLLSISIDPDGSRVRTFMYKGTKLDENRVEFLGYATYNGPPLKRLVWKKDGDTFRFVSSQMLDGAWLIRDSKLGNRVWQPVKPCAD